MGKVRKRVSKAGAVEAFADVAVCSDEQQLTFFAEPVVDEFAFLGFEAAEEHQRVEVVLTQARGQRLYVFGAAAEHQAVAAALDGALDVAADLAGSCAVLDQSGVYDGEDLAAGQPVGRRM
jgi:hypothetical protein